MDYKEHFKKLHNRLNDLKEQNEQFLKQREQLLKGLNNKELADDFVNESNNILQEVQRTGKVDFDEIQKRLMKYAN